MTETGLDVVVGWITNVDDNGEPYIEFTDGAAVKARSIVPITNEHLGREAVVQFEGGDTSRPIIMGLIWTPDPQAGRTLVLEAQDEIILQCGTASMTLTRSGRVLIRGRYVVSRSSGVNRVQGASVQIN